MRLRKALLAGLLSLACGLPAVLPVLATELPPPVRVVDPADPGENLPSRGRSLFDRLFAVTRGGRSEIDLPFPFELLLARLDAQLQRDPASALPPAKRVLIPLGRSLQRTAAAPDYFAYPRVVVAVDRQPATAAAPLLKDRLYIGYQEKSAVLEIISYNEEAGRFEFQLLKDYRAGGKPRVIYANRTLCFACHQNGSPIFSRALWDETNANPQVAALLLASGRRFHGIAPERGIDIPYAIDNATERANGFALTQYLWRAGCGAADRAAQRCRAGLFAAALRHALSGGQPWTPDAAFEQTVAGPLRDEGQRHWPGGLAAGNPDIPNRNPLQGLATWPLDRAGQVALSHVPARFDPLLPRPPRGTWRADDPEGVRQLVSGLAEFVAEPDRRRLESALARTSTAPLRLTLPCRIAVSAPASRWALRCAAQGGTLLEGSLFLHAGRPAGGQLTRLTLAGGTALNNLELALTGKATPNRATLLAQAGGRPARTAEGNAIGRIEFRRGTHPASTGDGSEASVEIRQEFAALQQAIDRLAAGPDAATLFGPAPLPREMLFAALFAELGVGAPAPCCRAARFLPPPELEVPAVAPGRSPAAVGEPAALAFHPYCAACHQTAETFPPNFLQGSPAEVASKLRHCAPRIYVRLAMADVAQEQREKTPMPPASVLPAFATDARAWRDSPARAVLMHLVEGWLHGEAGHTPQLTSMLAGGYEALRPCLPPH